MLNKDVSLKWDASLFCVCVLLLTDWREYLMEALRPAGIHMRPWISILYSEQDPMNTRVLVNAQLSREFPIRRAGVARGTRMPAIPPPNPVRSGGTLQTSNKWLLSGNHKYGKQNRWNFAIRRWHSDHAHLYEQDWLYLWYHPPAIKRTTGMRVIATQHNQGTPSTSSTRVYTPVTSSTKVERRKIANLARGPPRESIQRVSILDTITNKKPSSWRGGRT